MLEKHEVFFWLSSCSGSSLLLRSVQIWFLTCILRLRLRSGWTAWNWTGPVRRRASGYDGDDELHCRRSANLLSGARPSLNIQRETLLSTQQCAQSVSDLSSPPVQSVPIGYITFKYVTYASVIYDGLSVELQYALLPHIRVLLFVFFTQNFPKPTGFGFSVRFRDAALRPVSDVMTLLPSMDHSALTSLPTPPLPPVPPLLFRYMHHPLQI